MKSSFFSLGIDPGTVNFGAALLYCDPKGEEIEVVNTWHFNPTDTKTHVDLVGFCLYFVRVIQHAMATFIPANVKLVDDLAGPGMVEDLFVTIERFVSYGSLLTKNGEDIIQMVGMLEGMFNLISCSDDWDLTGGPSVHPIRKYKAGDWKIKLAQVLNRDYNFENPSMSLDKKFSLAAARLICDTSKPPYEKKINDHEADAVDLAALTCFHEFAGYRANQQVLKKIDNVQEQTFSALRPGDIGGKDVVDSNPSTSTDRGDQNQMRLL